MAVVEGRMLESAAWSFSREGEKKTEKKEKTEERKNVRQERERVNSNLIFYLVLDT